MKSGLILALALLLVSGGYQDNNDLNASLAQRLGGVKGKILLDGLAPIPKEIAPEKCKDCEDEAKKGNKPYAESLITNKNGTLKNVLVYVKTGLEKQSFSPSEEMRIIDQKLCKYEPHVICLMAGETLDIRNSDGCDHNINGSTENNGTFNFMQTTRGKTDPKKFEKPEPKPFKVKCNIHDWMEAWIHVLPHPKFAVTGDDGSFDISGLPAGKYTLEAWHERLGTLTKEIEVKESSSEACDFTFVRAGKVKGKVAFEGKAPEPTEVKPSKCTDCQKLKILKECTMVNKNNTLKNAVVYVKKGLERYLIPTSNETRTLERASGKFSPHVVALMAGETLEVKSSDTCTCNMKITPQKNKAVNLTQQKGSVEKVTFEKPEPKPFKVESDHESVEAWIHVLSHSKFAITGDEGTFEISGLPPGKFTIEVWHEELGTQTQDVTVKDKEVSEATFTFKK